MNQLGMNFKNTIDGLGGAGILTDSDLVALSGGVHRVYKLMQDGAWHTREEIELAAGMNGKPAAEGMRRMRELRRLFEIDVERAAEGRLFRYRLRPRNGDVEPDNALRAKWWHNE